MNRTYCTRLAIAATLVAIAAAPVWAGGGHVTSTSVRKGSSYGYTTGKNAGERFSYAIVKPSEEGEGLELSGSGDSDDWRELNRLIERDPREVLWVHMGDRSYVTRDGDAIAKARAILAPLSRIGDKQAELGDRQAEIGDRQAKLGDRQAELGDQQAELSERLASLSEQISEERSGAAQRSLYQKRAEIQRHIAELGRQMQALGRQQAVLGASQAALGREQSALGRQQSLASQKAQVTMRRHAEELLAQGTLEDLE